MILYKINIISSFFVEFLFDLFLLSVCILCVLFILFDLFIFNGNVLTICDKRRHLISRSFQKNNNIHYTSKRVCMWATNLEEKKLCDVWMCVFNLFSSRPNQYQEYARMKKINSKIIKQFDLWLSYYVLYFSLSVFLFFLFIYLLFFFAHCSIVCKRGKISIIFFNKLEKYLVN